MQPDDASRLELIASELDRGSGELTTDQTVNYAAQLRDIAGRLRVPKPADDPAPGDPGGPH